MNVNRHLQDKQPALSFPSMLKNLLPKSRLLSSRTFATSQTVRLPERKKNLNAAEQKEQNLFNKNKEKLERLESDATKDREDDISHPSSEVLQEKGEEARVEQNRPDDGVY